MNFSTVPPFDFIASGDFNSVTVTVAPATERARDFFRQMFGCAGVAPSSIEMPKAKFSDFVIFAQRKGYSVA
jgi:hypothetical protein